MLHREHISLMLSKKKVFDEMCHKWRCNLYPPIAPPPSTFLLLLYLFSCIARGSMVFVPPSSLSPRFDLKKSLTLRHFTTRFLQYTLLFRIPKENEKCISWNPPTHVGWKYDPIRIVSSTLSMLVGISVWAVKNYRIRFSSLFTFWINWVS